MRRRLRKKRRLAEFRELGFLAGARFPAGLSDDEVCEASWRFVAECVEPLGLSCGGGGGGRDDFAWFVTRRRRGGATAADRARVEAWLEAYEVAVATAVGPLVDAWHAPETEYLRQQRALFARLREGLS